MRRVPKLLLAFAEVIGFALVALVAAGCASGDPSGPDDSDAGTSPDPRASTQDLGVPVSAPTPTPSVTAPGPATTEPTDVDAAPPPPPPPEFDQFQTRNLADINAYRATLGLAPLTLDVMLSAFALAGSGELSQDHSPHAHFLGASSDGSIWSSGFGTSAGENQGDPNGWPVLSYDAATNEVAQIDAIQQAMFDEGPGDDPSHGHYMNMMNASFTKVGVGLLEVGGALYLTNDFSN